LADRPAKALPLLLAAEVKAYRISEKPCAPGVGDAGLADARHHGDGGAGQHQDRRDEDGDRHHLHVVGLDLLAQVFGRAADHQAGDEHRQHGEDQHAVQAGADAAEDHFAELHQQQRHQAAERHQANRAWR
jgi:hypothetical protein